MNLRFWNFNKKLGQQPKNAFNSRSNWFVLKKLELNKIKDFIRYSHPRILASLILVVFAVSGAVSLIQTILKNGQNAQAAGNPTISSITPNTGSPLGGYNITINGTNFAPGGPQRVVTITNPGSTVTNYEGNFTLDTASLITAGKLRSDCGDIRVKDSDQTTDINYWIDGQCNSTSTIIWFKKPSLASGSNSVYLRYGISSLTSQSNIANFSFGSILTSANNRLWLSANNLQASNTFTPSFTNASGVTASGADLTNTGTANSWTNGITSIENLASGNGYVSSRIQETNTFRMFGLSKGNTDSNYTDIDFAIYPNTSATIEVFESGVSKGNYGAYALNDILSVEASGDKILYKKNGIVLYTSAVTLTATNYPLILDSSFYTSGATLRDVKMCIGICDGSSVQTWSDRSGNGNNAIQATGANRPQIKSGVQNGKPVVRFDGINDGLNTSLTASRTNVPELSVLTVAKAVSDSTARSIWSFDGTTGGYNRGLGVWSTQPNYNLQGGSGSNTLTVNTNTNQYNLLTANYSTSNSNYYLYINGTENAKGNAETAGGNNNTLSIGYIPLSGGSQFINGDIPEVILFNSTLSTQDRQTVETYLNTKYNLYGSNPTTSVASENISSANVTFGGVPAASVTFVSGTQLIAKVPASTLAGDKTGSVNVVVTNSDGLSTTLNNGFTYAAPSISSVSPNTGSTLGGYDVTINGANFSDVAISKSITITNSSTVLTDYQVKVNVDTASLILGSKMRSDCGDIRFKDSNGITDLNYWLEDGCNTANTVIWVKIPSIPNGGKTISLTYGISTLTSASNGDGVFDMFNDFSTGNKANFIYPTGFYTINNGVIELVADNNYRQVNTTNIPIKANKGYRIVSKIKSTNTSSNHWHIHGIDSAPSSGYQRFQILDGYSFGGGLDIQSGKDNAYTNANNVLGASANNTWYKPEIIKPANSATISARLLDDNYNQIGNSYSDSYAAWNTDWGWTTWSYNTGVTNYIDFVYARNYSTVEPTVSVSTSETGTSASQFNLSIGANLATNVRLISSSQLTATVPASTLSGDKTGSVNVLVTNPDGLTGTLTNGFTYSAPVVSSITPNSGPNSGGTFVTVTGSNFSNLRASGSLISRYISINNPSSTITNYEGNITLDTASLITAGKLRSDCGDIRVKDSDGTTDLNYWVESGCNTSGTIIWFKKPSLPAGSSAVVLKYGDSALTSLSSIANFSFGPILTGSSNKIWVSGNTGTGVATDGATVTTWSDRTANSNNFTGSTTLKTGINGINGKPVINFSGTQTMSKTGLVNFQFSGANIFAVSRVKAFTQSSLFWSSGLTNADYINAHLPWEDQNIYWDFGGYGTAGRAGGASGISLNTPYLWNLGANVGGGQYVQRNGTTIISGGSQATNNITGRNLFLGSCGSITACPYNGDIAEFIIFKAALSSQDQNIISTYLNTKYNLYRSNPSLTLGDEASFRIAINGQLLGGTKFISSTTLTGYIPTGTGTQNVTVTNSDGTSGTLNNSFTYGTNGVANPIFDLAITSSESEIVPLAWSSPFNNGSGITDYIIKYSTDNFATETVVSDGVNTNTSYTVTGLTAGVSYKFKVLAVNALGNSPDSNIASLASLDCDTNLNGADFTPANGATLTGRYCNIGTFTVSSGFTVNTALGSKVKIYAQNASILGTLSANNSGYTVGLNSTNGNGPGGGIYSTLHGAGGGYGGNGGNGNGTGGSAYGSITEPTDLGSGGSGSNGGNTTNQGNGGGAIKLNITGTLTNNGTISANGQNFSSPSYQTGGGSGGSIWITTNTLAGTGTITANGGNGSSSGAGGGGRIALYYQAKTLSGAVTANGGTGSYGGGAGTVYEKSASQTYGSLRIDDTNVTSSVAATPINSSNLTLNTLDSLAITNKTNAILNKDLTILNTSFDVNTGTIFTVNNSLTSNSLTTLTNSGTFNFSTSGNWVSNSLATVTLAGTLTLNTYTLPTINTVTINSGGNLTTTQNTTVPNTPYKTINLIINDLTINSGGTIQTNYLGYTVGLNSTNGNGPGGGIYSTLHGAGGGYGGNGGNGNGTGGSAYGSITEPTDLGSGGSGSNGGNTTNQGNGGGAIKLNITGTLTNNGTISANGQNFSSPSYQTGGGSGGSIWITTNTLAGTGTITANGGNGSSSGAGGGGRIALYYQAKTLSGAVTANGGTGSYGGGAGTVYEPNTPETGLTNAVFSPNPNPISTGATFTAKVTNLKNTFGLNLYTGTCSLNITGPSYSQSYSGTVNTGVCTISGTYPAPTVSGSGYTAAISVTGATTQTKNVSFSVATAASNKAKINTGSIPVYTSVAVSPANPFIGVNYTISGSGFVDSANDQALNGIPCVINITGPSSYSNTFTTSNIMGGNCSYSFNSNTLPKVAGTYTASISLVGDSATLTTNIVNFNYYFDIYLTNGSGFDLIGKIPGALSSSQSSIVLGDPAPIFTSPVIKRYDNSTLIPTGTPCAILITIASGSEVAYTSTTNVSGQCVVTVANNSFTGGSLSLRNRVTIQGQDFYTNSNTSILIQNFPSNKAKADATVTIQPKLTAQTSSPTPTLIGSNYTLSVTGLEDSLINARPLAGLNCNIIMTGPNSYTDTQTVAVTAGTCSKTYSGNSPQTPGQYSFKVQIAGDNNTTLETPTVNFDRLFNVKLTGGTAGISGSISGSTTSSQNPILLNTATTLTSPTIRNYADNANVSGLTCRNVLKINSGSDQFYNGTLNGSGQCVTNVPSGDITALGTAYIKTQISAINSDYNSVYTFENSNTVLQIRNPPTSQICANATFRDDNKNGTRDGAEPLLAGVTTRLKDASNTTILNTLTTTGSGPNCFTGLFDDTYYIQQVLPTGGTLQTASLSYQVILGVATTENRSFGYNGDAVICPSPTFIDINENGVYESGGGDYYYPDLVTDLYLTSDQNTSLEQITTNSGGTACFSARNPGSYTIKQSPPANTTSTTGTITSGKVSQNITLGFGANINQKFGYRIIPSQKAKPQTSPNQSKPIYASIIQLTSVNPTYNEKAFVNYPVSATISGLVDSNTNLPLNSTGSCSATFSGPSFASPVTVSSLDVASGSCVVNNTNNSTVIPTSVAAGNSVQFNIEGPSGTLTSDTHSFEVFSGNVSICALPFADYNLNGTKDSNEPYLSGIEVKLYKDAGVTLLDTISSNISGTACFTNQTPGVTYTVTQTAPSGTSLTTGTLSRDITPFPETINNFAYAYKGDSTITPSAFRDDNRNGVNNSETALNGIFTAALKDYAGNVISSNLSINGSNQFVNLLPTTVLGGNYTLQVSAGSLVISNTTNNNPATVSSLNNASNQDVSFGFANDATICPNPSFYDYNKNGTKDGSETNINNLTTRLLLASDSSEIATLSTTGSNCFTGIIPNNYIIEQTHPTGAVLTTTPGTQASGKITVTVTAAFGVNNTQAFGYKGNATICPSPTFQDLNKDGIKDVDEPLISGLTTVLKDMSGVTMQSLTTNGSSCFTEILAGDYQIVQTPPSNSTSTTGGITKNVSVISAQSLDIAFGYNGEPLICPIVYRDDNGDGTQNNGETSLEGSTLTLKDSLDVQVGNTILSNGTVQCFNPVTIGQNYTVTATSPSGYTATTSLTASIAAAFGQRYTPSFGFNGNSTVCVTNSFNDTNTNGAVDSGESSIADLVTKIRVNGSGTDIQSLTTDSNGHVCFNPLAPGQYKVLQTAPAGTGSTTGGDQVFTLSPSQNKDIVFGYSGSGAICVDLYNDADFNARKDTGENYISNISVELYWQTDLLTPISTKTTDSSTNVCFTQLVGGNYQTKIVTIGYINDNTFASTTGGNTQNVTLAEGNIYYSTQSFGYTNNTDFVKGAFRGLVYMDRNENGLSDTRGNDAVEATIYDNDIPIVEKQVNLLKDSGGSNFVLQATQITNSIGEFNFLGLDPGDYKVEIANDTGIVAVTPGPAIRTMTITTNEKRYDLYGFQYTAQICPSIYVDKNNNGILDGADIDLIQTNGLYVQLEYQSYGGTQIYGGGNSNGILLNSSNPCVTKVPPRNYTLKLSNANNLASMFDTAYYSQRNPSGNPTTTIYLGNTTTPNIRYYTNAVSTLSSIYGKVWNDRQATSSNLDSNGDDNKTGVENLNSKNYDRDYDNDFAYPGLTLNLIKCGPVAGETTADLNAWNAAPPSTTTDSNGDYTFASVPTGAYAVVVNTSGIPYFSQISTNGGRSGAGCDTYYDYIFFNNLFYNTNNGGGIAPGTDAKYDAIYYFTPSVNLKLWIDTNKNGTKEAWEDDAIWRPYSANFELSNSAGIIDFNYLKYFINGYLNYAQSVVPDIYTATILNNTGNSNIPSNYSIIGSVSQAVDTTTGSKTAEFGIDPTQNSSISAKVFIDRDGDNTFEPNGQDGNVTTTYDNDEKLAGRSVSLYYGLSENQLVSTSTTDSEGNYSFTGLAEGAYSIKVNDITPTGTVCLENYYPSSNCNARIYLNKDTNYTQNLRSNYNAKLRLMSFYDAITNYVRDDEFETDVNQGTFTLIAPDGTQVGVPVNPIIKDGSGSYYLNYQFTNLAPGTYTVQLNGLPSSLRGYSNPDTITIGASQSQERDYPLTALTNNTIQGDIFIDKQQGVNQGFNNVYNPNGGDNNAATLFDNDEFLANTQVSIVGPLGTYTTNTSTGSGYTFSSLPSGKYKLYKLINNGSTQVPYLTLDSANANIGNLVLQYSNSSSWVRNATNNTQNTTYRYTNEISAYCYDDKDLNGQITYYPDSNTYDRRSNNCSFEIEASNGEKISLDSTTGYASDPNGSYTYGYYYKSNLPPGSYILRNTNNQSTSTVTNFTRYEPSTLNYGITREANVNFAQNSLNQVSRANMFLNFSPITNNASIIGQVYIDRNNNGIYEPNGADGNPATLEDNDVPLKNVLLNLSQNPINISKNTRTDENGYYQITDLPAGIFKILVDLVQK